MKLSRSRPQSEPAQTTRSQRGTAKPGFTPLYRNLPLGLTDASVIACAERHGGRLLSLDLRHFVIVAREGKILLTD